MWASAGARATGAPGVHGVGWGIVERSGLLQVHGLVTIIEGDHELLGVLAVHVVSSGGSLSGGGSCRCTRAAGRSRCSPRGRGGIVERRGLL